MTRRVLLGAVFGMPLHAVAPAHGFHLTGELAFSPESDYDIVLGPVTLTLSDPVLLQHCRDLIEQTCCLSLTPGRCR